jgi:hypothetical protein
MFLRSAWIIHQPLQQRTCSIYLAAARHQQRQFDTSLCILWLQHQYTLEQQFSPVHTPGAQVFKGLDEAVSSVLVWPDRAGPGSPRRAKGDQGHEGHQTSQSQHGQR